MIMARRLTLEGVHVQAVFEIQPIPSGLPRNIEQCLNDYGIPLYLSHTCLLYTSQEYEAFKENPEFNPKREGIIRFDEQDDETKAKLIAEDPNYGEVICRCEKVTKAEILKAIHNPLGVHTMTGIKYRTRSMRGRCQGGYCQMRIEKMIEDELGVKDTDIRYARQNSWMFTGEVRKEEQ